ncbi:MAG: hypothetical protein K2O73_11320 [Lachnospiraceae bacterium]|nr:hypothetical protein [Lachnospiraceae bacterium]
MVLHETKTRLSKAVLLKDAFTGEPVSSGIRIRSLSGGKTEKKGDGHFLFLDVDSPELEIEVESPIYQRRCVRLTADHGAQLDEILMYPSPAYPLRAGNTVVRGRVAPESVLSFYIEDERGCCRLISDYKKGEGKISFYLKGRITGTIWHIQEKQKKAGEYFRVKHMDDSSEMYELWQPLKATYSKKDTVIHPAQETIADENGEFYLLFAELPQETCLLHYSYGSTGGEMSGETEIIRGKENHILAEED